MTRCQTSAADWRMRFALALRCAIALPLLLVAYYVQGADAGHAPNGTTSPSAQAPALPPSTSACDPCDAVCLKRAPRAIDTVWRINTRCLGCPSCGTTPNLAVSRFVEGKWQDAALADYLATVTPGAATVLYIHGNDVESWEADELGWTAYDAIACGAPADMPLHFVIWSWPSNRTSGPLRDVRDHAVRSSTEGYYLGWVVSQLPPDSHIGLIGFSFGGRAITGALNLVGGGSTAGMKLPGDPIPTHNIRAVLQSPAVDYTWIMSGGAHEHFATRVETLVVQYNPCDSALRRFRWTDKCTKPVALGYVGIGVYRPSADRSEAVREENVSGYIGSSHRSYAYLHSSELMRRAREVLLTPAAVVTPAQ